jgi:hypothetical protein
MKSYPLPCQIQAHDYILPKPHVVSVDVKSHFSQEEIRQMRQEAILHCLTVKKIFSAAQYIPWIGRLAAHDTVNYWVWFGGCDMINLSICSSLQDQLDQVALKRCVPKPREWWQ